MSIDRTMRVGVLMGGLSTERKVSFKSGGAVSAGLRERGWDVVDITVNRDLPARLIEEKVDVAWIALHGRFGEDGCVQGLLEVMGIPYTGSDVRSSAVAMDKIATKRALSSIPGISMARDVVLRSGDSLPRDMLPAVVKPSVGGSTIGISIAKTPAEFRQSVEEALQLHGEVLVEEYVAGDEITVAVLDGSALPVVRILPKSGFFDFEAKYSKGMTVYEVPAEIPEQVALAAQEAAVAAFRAVGCGGLCRADFIIREDLTPVFLEINTIPGMTATSLSPMAAGA
ncbi:MAG: D-alanine--D-alanine ligase, partial [Proteobacteria bacterium]|nr:D-alanine--D-alanine ligase [Pseudomonadota bacterium]